MKGLGDVRLARGDSAGWIGRKVDKGEGEKRSRITRFALLQVAGEPRGYEQGCAQECVRSS